MKLTGSYKLNVKRKVVWQALNNPDILKQCIPGCESFEKESDTIFNAAATNQIGPMNTTFSGKVLYQILKKIRVILFLAKVNRQLVLLMAAQM